MAPFPQMLKILRNFRVSEVLGVGVVVGVRVSAGVAVLDKLDLRPDLQGAAGHVNIRVDLFAKLSLEDLARIHLKR